MQHPNEAKTIALPGFVFDPQHLELTDVAGARVSLRRQALTVLKCLAQKANRVVSKDELMSEVWPGLVVSDDSLVQCIKDLRRVLKDQARRVVQTEPRRGYRLVTSAATLAVPAAVTPLEDFHQSIHFANGSDGTRIAYAISGDGPPLVRAPHWMTHLEFDARGPTSGPLIRRLSQHHRLFRYDNRGCGLSDREVPVSSLDQEVSDLEAVVDAAGLDRFALFGISAGAAISIRYAARHPQRVSKLIVSGGFVRGGQLRGERATSLENIMAFSRLIESGWGERTSAFQQIWTSLIFPGATPEQQDGFNAMQRLACSPKQASMMHRMYTAFDAREDLPRVQCPTLVLHSPDDAIIPFEEGRLVAAGINGARLVPFASRNHFPLPCDAAYEHVLQLIGEFLLDLPSCQEAGANPVPVATRLRVVTGSVADQSPRRTRP